MNLFNFMEYKLLQEFQKSLSEEEKQLFKDYIQILPPPKNDDERRKINTICMAYIEGVRKGRELEKKA